MVDWPTLGALVALFAALVGVLWYLLRSLEKRFDVRIDGVNAQIDSVNENLGAKIDALSEDVKILDNRVYQQALILGGLRNDFNDASSKLAGLPRLFTSS